jgi:hypothetical protein
MPYQRLWIALSAVLLACLSLHAYAEDLHWYGGAMAGESRIDIPESFWNDGSFVSSNLDDTGLSYQAFVGYQLVPRLSVEVAYLKLGKTREEAVTNGVSSIWIPGPIVGSTHVGGMTLEGVATWPVTSQLSVYARGGLFAWDTNTIYHYLITSNITRINNDGVSGVGGVGLQKALGRQWYLRAEWQYTTAQLADKQEIGASFGSVGLIHYFH